MAEETHNMSAASDSTGQGWRAEVNSNYEKGMELCTKKKFEDAVEPLSNALEKLTGQIGELDPETAKYYYAYADAVLKSTTNAVDVLGASLARASASVDVDGDELLERAQSSEEDLELAWQLFEIAKLGFKNDKEDRTLDISMCHERMADILMEGDKFEGALKELEIGLSLQKQILPDHDARLYQVPFRMALCALYSHNKDAAHKSYSEASHKLSVAIAHHFAELTNTPRSGKSAVEDEVVTNEALDEFLLKNPNTEAKVAEIKSLKELQVDLNERIGDLKLDIAPVDDDEKGTTIGFGSAAAGASSSKVNFLGVKGHSKSEASSSSSSSSSTLSPNVKRKIVPETVSSEKKTKG